MKQQAWKDNLVRFHIDYGPTSLFERVRYKMKDVHELRMDGPHFNARKSERDIPEDVINHIIHFDISEWKLVTAEVRADKGKFYNSTWEYRFNETAYWITIGIGNSIMTIVKKESSGIEKCITSGHLYDFVEMVNKELMDNEQND